jgi:hypothetical protein
MEITYVPIEFIIPYAFNNRTHPEKQINHLANSIQEFGFTQPLVVDEDHVLLMGHGRLLAAKKLNMREVPIYKLEGLSKTRKEALRVLDNKLSDDSEWDTANLKLVMASLKEDSFEVEKFGLDDLDFGDPPEIKEKGTESESVKQGWMAVITLKVPADTIDHFEPDLDDLLGRFNGIAKEKKEKNV